MHGQRHRPAHRPADEVTSVRCPPGHVAPRVGPAPALLALQAAAGNRAVTATVQRFLEKPGASTKDQPTTNKGVAKPGWVENGRPPVGVYAVHQDDRWLVWSKKKRQWNEPQPGTTAPTGAPRPAVPAPAPGGEAAGVAAELPVPPPRRTGPIMSDLSSTSGMSLAASAPGQDAGLPDAFMTMVLGHLDPATLRSLRLVNRWLLEHGSSALREYLAQAGTVSAALSGLSSVRRGLPPLIEQYRNAIKARPPEQLVVVSDQVTPWTVNELTTGLPQKAVYFGRRADESQQVHGGVQVKGKARVKGGLQVEGPFDEGVGGARKSKMHNKFVVGTAPPPSGRTEDANFLLSGSPNLTSSAMTSNIESAVLIRYPGIARLYREYARLIATRRTEDAGFTGALTGFNKRNVLGIRAALAPFVNVSQMLHTELVGADRIIVRMFLVGSGTEHDVVGRLCELKNGGAAVTVVVDESEVKEKPFVRDALHRLKRSDVTVATEQGKTKSGGSGAADRGIMHDKLILAHYPEPTRERWTVMIGSSGLTRNVDKNWNYENLLVIDDRALYDWFLAHHDAAEKYRTAGIPK